MLLHMSPEVVRCAWATREPLIAYHDTEWGVPVHDDRAHFELLTLEGAQAGLSWETILKKRDAYREAFDGFDIERVARYGARKIESLLENPGIVRNRLKVESTVRNARAVIAIQEELGSFDTFIWQFGGGAPRRNRRRATGDVPARTEVSDAMSKALAKRGFKFVGSTICYAYMHAAGMVNDHLTRCFRWGEVR